MPGLFFAVRSGLGQLTSPGLQDLGGVIGYVAHHGSLTLQPSALQQHILQLSGGKSFRAGQQLLR